MNCRHCGKPLEHPFLDLGFAPPSNAYLSAEDLHAPERWFPLKLYVCVHCWLVQTEDYARSDELFTADYAYFSSTSSGWLQHAKAYCEMITSRLILGAVGFMEREKSKGVWLQRKRPCLQMLSFIALFQRGLQEWRLFWLVFQRFFWMKKGLK